VHAGLWNSLAQTLIKIAAPGVPDFYQGTELWNFSLVDPDNRQPVDYGHRRRLLEQVQSAGADLGADRARELLEARFDGRLKLHVIAASLRFRRAHDRLFRDGDYVPLEVTGSRAAHVFAFARVHEREAAIAVVPRLTTALVPEPSAPPIGDIWADTSVNLTGSLGDRYWSNVLTCESATSDGKGGLAMRQVFGRLPVALLDGQ
jgi:(1->4)-alpha-D-glucan 1-alpha-D-glucosylmutase